MSRCAAGARRPPSTMRPRQHFDIGEWLGLMDFEAAAKISGARFVVMKGQLARLERALAQFMLDHQTGTNGYTEHYVPFMVNDDAMYGTGQLPKFAEDLFRTTDGRWLIPTAEVSLTNLVRENDPRGEGPAAAAHRLYALLPRRGGCGGARHARHDPPAPVLQGGTRLHHHARTIARGTGADDGLRRKRAAGAGPCLPRDAAVHRRHGLRQPHDL